MIAPMADWEPAYFTLQRTGLRPLRGFGRLVSDMESCGGLDSFRIYLALYECQNAGFAIAMLCESVAAPLYTSWHDAVFCNDLEAAMQHFEAAKPTCDDLAPPGILAGAELLRFAAQRVCRCDAAMHAFRSTVGAFLHSLCLDIA
jgi:hypothetical protein